MNRHLLLLFVCFLAFMGNNFAQKNAKLANKAYSKNDYYTAHKYYELAFKEGEDTKMKPRKKAESYYQMAQSCRIIYLFAQAETYYKKASELGEEKLAFPELDFHFAYTLKHNGKYAEAKVEFEKFLEVNAKEDNPKIVKLKPKAAQEARSCEVALQLIQTAEKGINLTALSKNVNTQYSDFAPHEVGNELYFSSLKFEREFRGRRDPNESKLKSLVGKILASKDKGFRAAYQVPNLNERYQSSGNSTISPDGQRIYFTKCQTLPSDEVRCAIYVSKRKGNTWEKPEPLPAAINDEKFTSTHPHIGYDSLKSAYFLYFVSNRTGGFGDLDIWRAQIINEASREFGNPENLGDKINSMEADATPHFHSRSQTLYFSSKWHYGLGGFDLFKSRQTSPNSWNTPLNLGVPINTAANDLYFWISNNDTTAYLASNRTGSKTLVGESCCNDIYALNLPVDFTQTPPDWLNPEKVDTPVVVVEVPKDSPVVVINVPKDTPVVINSVDTAVVVVIRNPNPPDTTKTSSPTGQEFANFAPISLYFHNDEPDSKSTAIVTKKTYVETYVDYVGMEQEYIDNFGLAFKKNPEQQEKAEQDVVLFFDEVSREFGRLNNFVDSLNMYLNKGLILEVQIKGFASPRASESYNDKISKRRISSFVNYLNTYKGGLLKKYVSNNQLKITQLPYGARTADKSVASEYKDINSIYSPAAARERRVEIVGVIVK